MDEPKTPTLDKIQEVKDESQAIGAFLDWLRDEKGIALAQNKPASWVCEHCGDVPKSEVYFVSWLENDDAFWRHSAKHCKIVQDVIRKKKSISIDKYQGGAVEHQEAGLYDAFTSFDKLLHEYFEIDPAEEEKERRSLLDYMRSRSAARARTG